MSVRNENCTEEMQTGHKPPGVTRLAYSTFMLVALIVAPYIYIAFTPLERYVLQEDPVKAFAEGRLPLVIRETVGDSAIAVVSLSLPCITLLIMPLLVAAGVGLLRRERWGWFLGLTFFLAGTFLGFVGFATGIAEFKVLSNVVALVCGLMFIYLLRPAVRRAFLSDASR